MTGNARAITSRKSLRHDARRDSGTTGFEWFVPRSPPAGKSTSAQCHSGPRPQPKRSPCSAFRATSGRTGKTRPTRHGFAFHTIDGARYWDERAYYAFTLKEIESDIEAPTGELDAMCRELVARAVDDERMLKVLHIPERYWTFIAASWKRGDPSLYGRFDLS